MEQTDQLLLFLHPFATSEVTHYVMNTPIMRFGIYKNRLSIGVTQQTLTCSKSTIETIEKSHFWCLYCQLNRGGIPKVGKENGDVTF